MTGVLILSALCLLAATALILSQSEPFRSRLLLLVAITIAVRLFWLLLTVIVFDQPESGGFAFSDDKNYHLVGERMADLWGVGQESSPEAIRYQAAKNQGFYYVTAGLYWIFGTNQYVVSIFNIAVAVCSVLLVYKIGVATWTSKVGYRAALVAAMLPDTAIWSVLQFKDGIVGLLVLSSVLSLQKIASGSPRAGNVIGASLSLLLLFLFRAEAALILAGAGAVVLITLSRPNRRGRFPVILGGIAIMFVAVLMLGWGFNSGHLVGAAFIERARLGASLELATLFAGMLNYVPEAAVNSAGLISLGFVLGVSDLWRLPIAALFVVLIPFPPWPRGSSIAYDMIAPASIPWLVLSPVVIIATLRAWRDSGAVSRVVLYYVTADWLMLSIFLFAFNPARHRVASVPLMILLAAAYWPRFKSTGWWLWMLSLTGMLFAMVAYELLM